MSVVHRWIAELRELILILRAFIEGRSGVLDDSGTVVEAAGGYEGEAFDAELDDPDEKDTGDEAESERDVIENKRPVDRLYQIVKAVLSVIIVLLVIGWLAWLCWRLSGWIGHSLLHVPGPVGNVVGALCVLGLIVVLVTFSGRLEGARRYRRACRHDPSTMDRRHIFYAITEHGCCPACMYAFDESQHAATEMIVCAECGARWVPAQWNGYLRTDPRGLLSELKTKNSRRACCLLDARGQVFRVRQDLDAAALTKQLESVRKRARWMTRLRIFFALTAIIALSASTLIAGIMSSGMISLVFVAIFVSCMLAISIIVLKNARRQRTLRQLQQLARTHIENGECPACTRPLEVQPHPIDACLCCTACGLGFDHDTNKRSHHTRKRVPESEIESNPIFFRAN